MDEAERRRLLILGIKAKRGGRADIAAEVKRRLGASPRKPQGKAVYPGLDSFAMPPAYSPKVEEKAYVAPEVAGDGWISIEDEAPERLRGVRVSKDTDPATGMADVLRQARGEIAEAQGRRKMVQKENRKRGVGGLLMDTLLAPLAEGYDEVGRAALEVGSHVSPGKSLSPDEVAGLKHPWDATEDYLTAGVAAAADVIPGVGSGPNMGYEEALAATEQMHEENPAYRLASPANWLGIGQLGALGTRVGVGGAKASVAGVRAAKRPAMEALGKVAREPASVRMAKDVAKRNALASAKAKALANAATQVGQYPSITVNILDEWSESLGRVAKEGIDTPHTSPSPAGEAIDFTRGPRQPAVRPPAGSTPEQRTAFWEGTTGRAGGGHGAESITGPTAGRVASRTVPGETVSTRTTPDDFFGEGTALRSDDFVQEGVQTTAPRTEEVVRDELYPWWRESHEAEAKGLLRGELKAQGTPEAEMVLDDMARAEGYRNANEATAARTRAGMEPPAPEPPPAPGAAPGSTTLNATVPGVHPLLKGIGSMLFGDVEDAATAMKHVRGVMPAKDVPPSIINRAFRDLFASPEAKSSPTVVRPLRSGILSGRREVTHANNEINAATKALKRTITGDATESMERVFDALDGRKFDPSKLNMPQKVLYDKWRKWLDRIQEIMSDVRGDPEWGIKDYITHVFPDKNEQEQIRQWIAYGMGEVPRKKAFKYFDKMRTGNEGYSRNLDDVQKMYLNAAIRKAHLNKAFKTARPEIEGTWAPVFDTGKGVEVAGTAPLRGAASNGHRVKMAGERGKFTITIKPGDKGEEFVHLYQPSGQPDIPDKNIGFALFKEPGVPSDMAKRLVVEHGGLKQIPPGQALLEPVWKQYRKVLEKFGLGDPFEGYTGGNYRYKSAHRLVEKMQGKIYKNPLLNRWITEAIYQNTLGMANAHMALHNLIGGNYMTMADAGLANWGQAAIGIIHRQDKELLAFLKEMKPELRDFYLYQEYGVRGAAGSKLVGIGRGIGKAKRTWDKASYSLFNAVEGPVNRDIAAGAYFVKGRRMGLKGQDMVDYVREGIARTQFYYMLTDSPGITQIPLIGPIASQLMTYTMRAGNRFLVDFSRGAKAAAAGDAKGAKRYFGRLARRSLYAVAVGDLVDRWSGRSISSVVGMHPADLPFFGDVVRRKFGKEIAEARIPGVQGIHGVEAPGMKMGREALANFNSSDPQKWTKWWSRNKGIVIGLQNKQITDVTGIPDWMAKAFPWMGQTEYTGETAEDGTPEIRLLDRKGELIRMSSVGIEAKDIYLPGQNTDQESLYNASDQVRIMAEEEKFGRTADLEKARELYREARQSNDYSTLAEFQKEKGITLDDLKASLKARGFNRHVQTIVHQSGARMKAKALLEYASRPGFTDQMYVDAFQLAFPRGPKSMERLHPETKRQIVTLYEQKIKRLK